MMIPSAGVIRIRYSKWLPPLSPFPRVSSSCPVSPGSLSRSTSGSDPGFFQTSASILGLEHVGFFVCLLRAKSVSYSFPALSPNSW